MYQPHRARARPGGDELDTRALALARRHHDHVVVGRVEVDRRGRELRLVVAVHPALGLAAPLDVGPDVLELQDGDGAQLSLVDDAARLAVVQVVAAGLVEELLPLLPLLELFWR